MWHHLSKLSCNRSLCCEENNSSVIQISFSRNCLDYSLFGFQYRSVLFSFLVFERTKWDLGNLRIMDVTFTRERLSGRGTSHFTFDLFSFFYRTFIDLFSKNKLNVMAQTLPSWNVWSLPYFQSSTNQS